MKKTYFEWKKEWCKENNLEILDDDGARMLDREKRLFCEMTKEQACAYLIRCTVQGILKGASE